MATKVDQDESFDNCLWSNRVMEFGKHRISLKLMKGEGIGLAHLFGLVCDGAEWNKFHGEKESTDAWYMVSIMKAISMVMGNWTMTELAISSMEADLHKGTLGFWVDGKQHGPGYSTGVQGRVRWAVNLYLKGNAVAIVPTPELQPCWSASWVPSESDEE